MSQRMLIENISPALRGLLAQGADLARVRFEEASGAAPKGALSVAIPASATDPKSIVETLRAVVEGGPPEGGTTNAMPADPRETTRAADGTTNVIAVQGVGLFHVEPPATTTGRAAGKIAVVTGAAQGFGLEIAQDLAAEGACVVLGDVNAGGAAQAAEAVCARLGAGRALGLAMNVTSGESIAGT